MLRRKRNPKGCKKAQKDCKKSHKKIAKRATNALQKSLTYRPIKPQLSVTLGLIECYVRLF